MTESVAFLQYWWQRVLHFCSTDDRECCLSAILITESVAFLQYWWQRVLPFCNTDDRKCCLSAILIVQLTESVAFLQYWLQRVLPFCNTDDRECCLSAVLIALLTESVAFLRCWLHDWQRVLPTARLIACGWWRVLLVNCWVPAEGVAPSGTQQSHWFWQTCLTC